MQLVEAFARVFLRGHNAVVCESHSVPKSFYLFDVFFGIDVSGLNFTT